MSWPTGYAPETRRELLDRLTREKRDIQSRVQQLEERIDEIRERIELVEILNDS